MGIIDYKLSAIMLVESKPPLTPYACVVGFGTSTGVWRRSGLGSRGGRWGGRFELMLWNRGEDCIELRGQSNRA